MQANVLIMLASHCWRIIDLGIAARTGALPHSDALLFYAPIARQLRQLRANCADYLANCACAHHAAIWVALSRGRRC